MRGARRDRIAPETSGQGARVETAADLRKAFDEALAAEGPSLVEIMADPLLI